MTYEINILVNEDEIRDIQIETDININDLTFDQVIDMFNIQLNNDESISSIVNVETNEVKFAFWSILIDWSVFY